MAIECKHGQLARSCQLCELEAENERLRAAATSVVEAYDFWDADTYERDGPGREIEKLREVLGGKWQAALDAAGGE